MFTAKISACTGPVRSSFMLSSAMALVPPGARTSGRRRDAPDYAALLADIDTLTVQVRYVTAEGQLAAGLAAACLTGGLTKQ
jgi:hypothetical protein